MREMLQRSGEVGHDLLEVDWSATPLGPLEAWPQSLESAVRVVLTSRFSMWMCWGPDLTFFCNDAYRRNTLGKKYPWALGRPASQVWSEIWDDLTPRVDAVTKQGVSTWDESLLLFLERSDFTEETYHTFSYSPLYDDDGLIAGLLCVVSEDTEEVVAHRRMQTLRDLGARRAAKLSESDTIANACQVLSGSSHDLPFSLVYLFEDDGTTARRACLTGFEGDHPAAPQRLSLANGSAPVWPAADALAGRAVSVGDLPSRFDDLPSGAWDQPPTDALVVPLASGTQAAPYGFQVFGLNRYRPLDQGYRDFCELVAGQLATGLTDARAYEFEKARAETLAELDQAKTDFFTNVSHEFRTPLTLLLGPAEDALSDEVDVLGERQRERVEVILRNGQRLLKLVNTLLDFSRLESGRVEARFEPVDLAQYTRELASMFDTAADRLGLSLALDCPPLPEPVHVDRDLWAKVVLNLLSNALKYTFDGGITVRVSADSGRRRPGRLRHRHGHRAVGAAAPVRALPPGGGSALAHARGVRDRAGPGRGAGDAARRDRDRRQRPGRGQHVHRPRPLRLRAPSAEQLAAPAQGESATVAAVAQGFIAETAHWSDERASREGRAVPTTGTEHGQARVLVVEDNADIREYVAGLLSADYDVQTAVDGMDGLALARELGPDLVLTDVMMPRMDGFELLAALQADPLTVGIPVVMLSARAGEEGTLQGLDAGADDYLVKPFTARELRARVRSNLELDRARRTRRQLERGRTLLDQAQRLARVGSWEIDLDGGTLEASEEFLRITGRTAEDVSRMTYHDMVRELIHPDDQAMVQEALDSADRTLHYETRMVRPSGGTVLVSVYGEVVLGDDGRRETLRGSVQDITERRAAEEALALAAANAEAAAREHTIADQLQRSLLPQTAFDLEHLEVATFYRAGVEGTQVGGDWYDVIELGGGRTALVVGDVMGRGVRAAAVMGQLRAAVRAYARLDLPPADLLESLDGLVRDIGDDQIVTCIYAVFDPADRVLRFANAGHLPPIVSTPGGACVLVGGDENPPLGVGPFNMTQHEVSLDSNDRVLLYTDGLVERRGEDLELGIHSLVRLMGRITGPVDGVPEEIAGAMLPDGPDDDVAILVARVDPPAVDKSLSRRLDPTESAVADARHVVTAYLEERGMPAGLVADAALATSELVTNAVLHGRPPVDLRLRIEGSDAVIEVRDQATYQPRKLRPDEDDEHGRGLQIVAALSARWGTRATEHGKAVWCVLSARP